MEKTKYWALECYFVLLTKKYYPCFKIELTILSFLIIITPYCFKRYIVGHKIKHKSKVKEEKVVDSVEEVEYNDQFVDIANKALNTSIKYKYAVLGAVVAAILIAGILAFVENSQKKQVNEISYDFSKAIAVYNAEIVKDTQEQGKFKNHKEKLNKSVEEFSAFIAKHPKSELAGLAKMYVANSYYELADYDNSLKYYKEAISSVTNKSLQEALMLKEANILSLKKENDKSIEVFNKIKDAKNTYVASASLYNLAELYKLKNDNAKSKEMIDELNKKYPESLFASKIKKLNK